MSEHRPTTRDSEPADVPVTEPTGFVFVQAEMNTSLNLLQPFKGEP